MKLKSVLDEKKKLVELSEKLQQDKKKLVATLKDNKASVGKLKEQLTKVSAIIKKFWKYDCCIMYYKEFEHDENKVKELTDKKKAITDSLNTIKDSYLKQQKIYNENQKTLDKLNIDFDSIIDKIKLLKKDIQEVQVIQSSKIEDELISAESFDNILNVIVKHKIINKDLQ